MDKFNELNCATNYKLGDKLTVSLKTKGGNFTIANGGTGLNSGLFKHMILSTNIIQLVILKIWYFSTCFTRISTASDSHGVPRKEMVYYSQENI